MNKIQKSVQNIIDKSKKKLEEISLKLENQPKYDGILENGCCNKRFSLKTWREDYKNKEIIPKDLEKIIKPGNKIYLGSGLSEPIVLTQELTKDQWRWNDCVIYHYYTISNQEFYRMKVPSEFRHNTLSIIGSPKMRDAINDGKADYTPISGSEIPKLLRNSIIQIDVALIQVSPPDRFGNCSLGINVDVNKTVVDVAKVIVAQINPKMPRTMGDSYIPISKIDNFLFLETDLMEYNCGSEEIDEEMEQTQKIAKFIAHLIDNGSTINLGVGKIPTLVPEYLTEKKDLAFYSEMLPESVMHLIEHENKPVTCKMNTYPHIMTSMALGTQKFYDYLDGNPFFEFRSTEYISNILRIAQNKKLISIYAALAVDLVGQVTNHKKAMLYSGMGSEPEFITGSSLSKGGKIIIALRSITKEGKSAIKSILTNQPVCVDAYQVQYIITEWGIANLYGKTTRERVLQMIGIAHPKFRKKLLQEAKQHKIIYEDQKIPETKDGIVVVYPEIKWDYHIRNTKKIIQFRPAKPTDERLVQDFYYRLSPEDRMKRFFSARENFPHKQTQLAIVCNYQESMYIIGFTGTEENKNIVAAGTYKLEENTGFAEMALTVDSDYRKIGLGKYITLKLVELAQQAQIKGLSGYVLGTNGDMLGLLKSLPYQVVFKTEGSETRFSFLFSEVKKE